MITTETYPAHLFEPTLLKEQVHDQLPDGRYVKWTGAITIRGRPRLNDRFKLGEIKSKGRTVRVFYDAKTGFLKEGFWMESRGSSVLWCPQRRTFPMTWAKEILDAELAALSFA